VGLGCRVRVCVGYGCMQGKLCAGLACKVRVLLLVICVVCFTLGCTVKVRVRVCVGLVCRVSVQG